MAIPPPAENKPNFFQRAASWPVIKNFLGGIKGAAIGAGIAVAGVLKVAAAPLRAVVGGIGSAASIGAGFLCGTVGILAKVLSINPGKENLMSKFGDLCFNAAGNCFKASEVCFEHGVVAGADMIRQGIGLLVKSPFVALSSITTGLIFGHNEVSIKSTRKDNESLIRDYSEPFIRDLFTTGVKNDQTPLSSEVDDHSETPKKKSEVGDRPERLKKITQTLEDQHETATRSDYARTNMARSSAQTGSRELTASQSVLTTQQIKIIGENVTKINQATQGKAAFSFDNNIPCFSGRNPVEALQSASKEIPALKELDYTLNLPGGSSLELANNLLANSKDLNISKVVIGEGKDAKEYEVKNGQVVKPQSETPTITPTTPAKPTKNTL